MPKLNVTPRELRFQTAYFHDMEPGPGLVIVAIIYQAMLDLVYGSDELKLDAARYFLGANYKHHLSLLGLPDSWLPNGILVDWDSRELSVEVCKDGQQK